MTEPITILIYLVSFILFVFIQALVINGIHYCFGGACTDDIKKGRICTGNIFFLIAPEFFERNKNKNWSKPLWGCVRCQSSFWGTATFLPTVIFLFGVHWQELFGCIIDIFSLVTLNWVIYKKL